SNTASFGLTFALLALFAPVVLVLFAVMILLLVECLRADIASPSRTVNYLDFEETSSAVPMESPRFCAPEKMRWNGLAIGRRGEPSDDRILEPARLSCGLPEYRVAS